MNPSDGGHSSVLRTLPLSGSLNKQVSGSATLRPNPLTRTSDTRQPLAEMLLEAIGNDGSEEAL